jgi:hypothetical protein
MIIKKKEYANAVPFGRSFPAQRGLHLLGRLFMRFLFLIKKKSNRTWSAGVSRSMLPKSEFIDRQQQTRLHILK